MSCPLDSQYQVVQYNTPTPSYDECCNRNGTSFTLDGSCYYPCQSNPQYPAGVHCQIDSNTGDCRMQGCQGDQDFCQGDSTYMNMCSTGCVPTIPQMNDSNSQACCNNQVPNWVGTCAPGYCPNGGGCVAYMSALCSNLDQNGKWNPACDAYLSQGGPGPHETLTNIIQNKLTGTYDSNNPFIKYAIEYCSIMPGACDSTLQNYCYTETRDAMATDNNLRNLCGCFMKPDEDHYPFLSKQVPVSCDPVCDVAVVQQGITDQHGNWTANKCTETVCIIDNVSIEIVNSSGGTITFEQLCGNCQGNACSQCYIDNVSINEINSIIQGGITLDQVCGTCYGPGNTPENPVTIPCSGNPGPGPGPNPPGPDNWFTKLVNFIKNNKWGVLAFSLFVLLFLITAVVIKVLKRKVI